MLTVKGNNLKTNSVFNKNIQIVIVSGEKANIDINAGTCVARYYRFKQRSLLQYIELGTTCSSKKKKMRKHTSSMTKSEISRPNCEHIKKYKVYQSNDYLIILI